MAKREKLQKTNAMRELERAGIAFDVRTYEVDENDLSGVHVAEQLGEEPGQGFKTLVCETASGGHAVCCIPVAEELDLKAAARALGEKSLVMMHVRDLVPVTGYMQRMIDMLMEHGKECEKIFPQVIRQHGCQNAF